MCDGWDQRIPHDIITPRNLLFKRPYMDTGRAVSSTGYARTDPVPEWYYDVRDIRDVSLESSLRSQDYQAPRDIRRKRDRCRIRSVCEKVERLPPKLPMRPSVQCHLVGPYGTRLLSTSRAGPWDNQTRLKALDPMDM